jgi:hypothetical protein
VQPITLSIHLREGQGLVLEVSGREQREIALEPRADGRRDFESLLREVEALQGRYPGLDGALLTASDSVKYQELVQAVEATRVRLPKIALSSVDGGA